MSLEHDRPSNLDTRSRNITTGIAMALLGGILACSTLGAYMSTPGVSIRIGDAEVHGLEINQKMASIRISHCEGNNVNGVWYGLIFQGEPIYGHTETFFRFPYNGWHPLCPETSTAPAILSGPQD